MSGQLAKSFAAAAIALAGAAGYASVANAAALCGTQVGVDGDGLVTEITVDTTWGDAGHQSPICLHEQIFVTNGATLTILPGTIVRGEPRTLAAGSVDGTPGALIITKDGRIESEGAPNNPVIMTTMAVDNDQNGVCDDFNAAIFGKDEWPGFVPGTCPGCVATTARRGQLVRRESARRADGSARPGRQAERRAVGRRADPRQRADQPRQWIRRGLRHRRGRGSPASRHPGRRRDLRRRGSPRQLRQRPLHGRAPRRRRDRRLERDQRLHAVRRRRRHGLRVQRGLCELRRLLRVLRRHGQHQSPGGHLLRR